MNYNQYATLMRQKFIAKEGPVQYHYLAMVLVYMNKFED